MSVLNPLVLLLAPFAPFSTEEIWERLGNKTSIHLADFPKVDESHLKEDSIEYPVCVNGKKRATLDVPTDATKDEMEKMALEMEVIQKWLEGRAPKKVIVVPNRMINVVI